MQDEPTPTELIKAVADFLRNEITPVIKGHNAFKLRVGINALDLVTRQLALEQGGDAAEAARLKQLLGADGSLIELNRALSEKIAKGEVDLQTPGLAEHLWQTTMDKLAVDQPNYASYKRELGNQSRAQSSRVIARMLRSAERSRCCSSASADDMGPARGASLTRHSVRNESLTSPAISADASPKTPSAPLDHRKIPHHLRPHRARPRLGRDAHGNQGGAGDPRQRQGLDHQRPEDVDDRHACRHPLRAVCPHLGQ